MASWGQNVVIAEPAPPVAHPARYLAPVFNDDEPEDAFLVPVLIVFGSLIVLVTLGGGLGEIAARTIAPAARVPVWFGFDVLAIAAVLTAYVLVSRNGLRFPTGKRSEEFQERRTLVAQGNVAWRCLPEPQRQANTEPVRAMNAAARLVLINPDDEEANTVLKTTARALHQLTLQPQDPQPSTSAPGA